MMEMYLVIWNESKERPDYEEVPVPKETHSVVFIDPKTKEKIEVRPGEEPGNVIAHSRTFSIGIRPISSSVISLEELQ